jgi:hypothetical protein
MQTLKNRQKKNKFDRARINKNFHFINSGKKSLGKSRKINGQFLLAFFVMIFLKNVAPSFEHFLERNERIS